MPMLVQIRPVQLFILLLLLFIILYYIIYYIVHYMRKKNYHWLRFPHTTQEKRANQELEYVRGKRHPKRLPDAWEDIPTTETKCWKDKRKTQYRCGKRDQRHEKVFEYLERQYVFKIEEYLESHNIPYRIEKIYKKYSKTKTIYKQTRLSHWFERSDGVLYPIFEEIILEKPIVKKYTYHEQIGWKIIWWNIK